MTVAESNLIELYKKAPAGPLKEVNQAGAVRLGALGFPTKKHEMFTFVNLRDFLGEEFDFLPEPAPATMDAGRFILAGCEKALVVLMDGKFSEELSNISSLEGAVTVSQGKQTPSEVSAIQEENDVFACVNALFLRQETVVEIKSPSGVHLQILHLSTGRSGRRPAFFPKLTLNASDGAKGTVLFESAGLDGASGYMVNTVFNVNLGAGASLDICRTQADPDYHFTKTLVTAKKDSRLGYVIASAGAKMARHHFECRLRDEGASLDLRSLSILDGTEQAHHYVRVHHDAPNCHSFEHYKNILNGKALSSVDSTVTVHPGSQLAVSRQLVNNLMFSKTARADSKPRLMIHADDVKCNHGSTVGRVDENQIFYLVSRGLSPAQARALIVTGFAKEVLERIPHPPAAKRAGELLLGKLGDHRIG